MDASVKFKTHALSGLNMVLTDGVHTILGTDRDVVAKRGDYHGMLRTIV